MRLLFIENRYATRVWESVATRLLAAGHEIHWMVQNPVFRPRVGCIHQLPFPRVALQHGAGEGEGPGLLKYPERSVTYYGHSRAHHAPYRRAIELLLRKLQPEVVFGEQTQLHELLAIDIARQMGVPFLCPSATRYPVDRVFFCINDTMQTLGGSGSTMTEEAARELLESIRYRRVTPSYMRAPQMPKLRRAAHRAADKVRMTWGWLRGERFLTPSPWRKMQLDRQHALNVSRWETTARAGLEDSWAGQPWVLYPLQLQPESNIEVWGYPWNDQVEIVRRTADALARCGAYLVVKPNPKCKYEMSPALCELCASHPSVIPMGHGVSMQMLLPHATAVLSVTGTVIMEAACSSKPIAVLGDHDLARVPGVRPIYAPEEIVDVLVEVREGHYPFAHESALIAYLKKLYADSYPGTPFDPVNQPELATEDNLHALSESFLHVLNHLPTLRSGPSARSAGS